MRAAKRNTPLSRVLAEVDRGPLLLREIQGAQECIQKRQAKAAEALGLLAEIFLLNSHSAAIRAVIAFADAWQKKPLTETGSLAEFVEYMELFREARGVITLPGHEGDAVRLITAHGAK